MTDKLRRQDLAPLSLDRDLKNIGWESVDGITVTIEDLDVDGDDVNRTAEERLLGQERGGCRRADEDGHASGAGNAPASLREQGRGDS